MPVEAGSSSAHLFRIQVHHRGDSLIDVGLPLPAGQPVIPIQNGWKNHWMVVCVKGPQGLALEFTQHLDQGRRIEGNHCA